MAYSEPKTGNAFIEATNTLQQLLGNPPSHIEFLSRIALVRRLLESILLPSDEFSVASNRVENAERYFESGERGAAKWELRMLRNQLQTHSDRPAYQHRRRLNRDTGVAGLNEVQDFEQTGEASSGLRVENLGSV